MIRTGHDRTRATPVASVEHPSPPPGRVPGLGDGDGQGSAASFVTYTTPERGASSDADGDWKTCVPRGGVHTARALADAYETPGDWRRAVVAVVEAVRHYPTPELLIGPLRERGVKWR